MRRITLTVITLALLLVNSSGWASANQGNTSADDFPSEVASSWFELLYNVVKTERTTPPPASRIYGITAVALYESIVTDTEENRSLVGQLNGLVFVPPPKKSKKLHWPTVANTALANTIRGLYPTISPTSAHAIKTLEKNFTSRFRATVPSRTFELSIMHGQAVASAILGWADGDGFSVNNNCPYNPAAVAGAWEPTPPAFNPNPLQPCWGQIRTMVLTSGAECPPPGHPAFSSDPASAFHAAASEVFNVGVALTAEQKTIANYWADGAATGTPPGHWIAIVSQIARKDRLSLATAAEAFARVGIAVHDAFINCWNTKYVTNLQRPVTYIRDNIDAAWTPFIVTPGFPTYTSGHSTQSGAAARVLTDMFGIKRFTDTTHTDHGLVPALQPRTFNSFQEASAEAAVSRLYGGIHFAFDNNDGLTCGECIGQAIHDRVSFR